MGGVAGRVEELRAVKDRAEIEAIRRGGRPGRAGFAMLRAGLKLGDSEKDAADALEGYLRRCGASAAASRRSSPSAPARPCRTPGRPGRDEGLRLRLRPDRLGGDGRALQK